MRKTGTEKSKKILELRKQGRTIREIQKELGMSSPSLVQYHIRNAPYKHVSHAKLKEELIYYKELAQKSLKKLRRIEQLLNN